MTRVLSGIQPSGLLHLGNYFGMIKPALELQPSHECFYFIADYHALTTVQDGTVLRENVHRAVLDFVACGLDTQHSVFFRQSAVPQVHELAWYLSTITPMGLLERCHSYKDKLAQGIKPNHGLFAYPVLMAADILLYRSQVVPVGRDQKQHVEVARDIALKFNDQYGEILTVPEPLIREETAVLPGLDGRKMSKSYDNTIGLFLTEKEFRKRVMSIKTDSTPVEAPKPLENSVLLALAAATADAAFLLELKTAMQQGGTGYGDLKQRLFEFLWAYLKTCRERRAELEAAPERLQQLLHTGEDRARSEAEKTLARVGVR